MCTISFIGDHYNDKWTQPDSYITWTPTYPEVSKADFDALKKEVEDMKALLKKAKIYDEETGQPDCHMEDKVETLKKVAELVGVDLVEIFGK